jgi:hypothetical protein
VYSILDTVEKGGRDARAKARQPVVPDAKAARAARAKEYAEETRQRLATPVTTPVKPVEIRLFGPGVKSLRDVTSPPPRGGLGIMSATPLKVRVSAMKGNASDLSFDADADTSRSFSGADMSACASPAHSPTFPSMEKSMARVRDGPGITPAFRATVEAENREIARKVATYMETHMNESGVARAPHPNPHPYSAPRSMVEMGGDEPILSDERPQAEDNSLKAQLEKAREANREMVRVNARLIHERDVLVAAAGPRSNDSHESSNASHSYSEEGGTSLGNRTLGSTGRRREWPAGNVAGNVAHDSDSDARQSIHIRTDNILEESLVKIRSLNDQNMKLTAKNDTLSQSLSSIHRNSTLSSTLSSNSRVSISLTVDESGTGRVSRIEASANRALMMVGFTELRRIMEINRRIRLSMKNRSVLKDAKVKEVCFLVMINHVVRLRQSVIPAMVSLMCLMLRKKRVSDRNLSVKSVRKVSKLNLHLESFQKRTVFINVHAKVLMSLAFKQFKQNASFGRSKKVIKKQLAEYKLSLMKLTYASLHVRVANGLRLDNIIKTLSLKRLFKLAPLVKYWRECTIIAKVGAVASDEGTLALGSPDISARLANIQLGSPAAMQLGTPVQSPVPVATSVQFGTQVQSPVPVATSVQPGTPSTASESDRKANGIACLVVQLAGIFMTTQLQNLEDVFSACNMFYPDGCDSLGAIVAHYMIGLCERLEESLIYNPMPDGYEVIIHPAELDFIGKYITYTSSGWKYHRGYGCAIVAILSSRVQYEVENWTPSVRRVTFADGTPPPAQAAAQTVLQTPAVMMAAMPPAANQAAPTPPATMQAAAQATPPEAAQAALQAALQARGVNKYISTYDD